MPSRRRTRLRIASSVLLAAALLEVGLQAIALWMWAHRPAEAARLDPDTRTVLCVGDSFTFGTGASSVDSSYPAQLEQQLRERLDPDLRVVNGGYPGRDSYTVIEELAGQLDRYRPELVCVLIGTNDKWRQRGRVPDRLTSRGGFDWRCRTLDLARLLLSGPGVFEDSDATGREITDAPGIPSDHPLLGRWTIAGTSRVVTFWADGICDLEVAELRWSVAPPGILLGEPGEGVRAAFERRGAAALVRPAGRSPIALAKVGDIDPEDAAIHARRTALARAHRGGLFLEVARIGRELLAEPDLDPDTELEVLPRLASAERVIGDRASWRQRIDRLRAIHVDRSDLVSATALARALHDVGEHRDAVRVASRALSRDDHGDPVLWQIRASSAVASSSRAEALATIEEALSVVPARSSLRASLHVLRIRALDPQHRAEIARSLVDAWIADPHGENTRFAMRLPATRDIEESVLKNAAREAGLATPHAASLIAVRDYLLAMRADTSWQVVLDEHVRIIARRSRAAGAAVVLGTYPFRPGELHDTLVRAAARHRVSIADVAGRFPTTDEGRSELFVADGHCNDAGYARIADAFAEAVIAATSGL